MSTEAVSPAWSRVWIRYVAIALLVLAAGAAFVFNSRRTHSASDVPERPAVQVRHEETAPEVRVETLSLAALNQPIRVTGTVRTDETVTLSTKATGLVERVLAKEGDRVRRGQLLIVIDDSDLRAQRDRAQAAVRGAEARLQQARTSRGIKNAAARSDYRRAEEALAAARTRVSQAKSLAGIAGTESETRVASARSALEASRERLKALQEGSRRQERAAAEAAVARAQAQVNRMRSMLERREQLYREKAVASEVVDNARRDYEVAQTDLEAAKQQLSLVQEGPRSEEIRVAEEAVRQAQAALQDAEANRARRAVSDEDVEAAENAVRQAEASLDAARAALAQTEWNEDEIRSAAATLNQARADVRYQDQLIAQTRIHSPVNGVVTKRQVQTGAAVVQMRNELMTLVSSDTLFFEATAPETSLPQLRPGLPARVMLDALPGRILPGTVREIIPVAEGTNRSVRLRISFQRPGGAATVVGGFARAQIQGSSRGATLSIPRTAIVSDDGEISVFVVWDGKAQRRRIRIGDPGGTGDRVPVEDGLRPGDRVVIQGGESLTDGQQVTLK